MPFTNLVYSFQEYGVLLAISNGNVKQVIQEIANLMIWYWFFVIQIDLQTLDHVARFLSMDNAGINRDHQNVHNENFQELRYTTDRSHYSIADWLLIFVQFSAPQTDCKNRYWNQLAAIGGWLFSCVGRVVVYLGLNEFGIIKVAATVTRVWCLTILQHFKVPLNNLCELRVFSCQIFSGVRRILSKIKPATR